MADYWTQNASFFRSLYQDERKTLDQVKIIAERVLSPPEDYTISTYEARLRDVLKLRKKLKKKDWYLIHHYVVCRGFRRGDYDVLLNGTQIRPDRVWKEIRRYGYHKETECGQVISLPRDVEVRPRRDLMASSIKGPDYSLSNKRIATNVTQPEMTSTSTCDTLQTWDDFSAALAQINTWTVSDQVNEEYPMGLQEDMDHCKTIELLHDQLPWNRLRVAVLEIISGRTVAYTWPDSEGHFAKYMPNDGFMDMTPGWLVAGFAATMYPTTLSLHARGIPSDPAGMDQLAWYQHFAKIVFQLTDAAAYELELFSFVEFGTALGIAQSGIILRIIRGHHLTIRAIWDRFCDELHSYARRPGAGFFNTQEHIDLDFFTNACVAIIDTILQTHPEWLETQLEANRLLMSCGWLRCKRLMLKLLKKGAKIHYAGAPHCSTLTHSAEEGDAELVIALANVADMNAVIPSTVDFHPAGMTPFAHFLSYIFGSVHSSRSPVDTEHVYQSLGWILTCGCGADVDGPYPASFHNFKLIPEREPSSIQSLAEQCRLTCIDAAFYYDHRAYQIMLLHTKQKPGAMTRPGVCEAAITGVHSLGFYLNSRIEVSVTQKSNFLRLILAEVFLLVPFMIPMPRKGDRSYLNPIRAKIARGLLRCGVRADHAIGSPASQTMLLEVCLASIRVYGPIDDLYAILVCFREETIAFSPTALELCIEDQGTELLDLIFNLSIVSSDDFRVHGSQALRQSIRSSNYEAMSWLIVRGVSVFGGNSDDRTIIGESVSRHFNYTEDFFLLCRTLVHHGAELKIAPGDVSCASLLSYVLGRAKKDDDLMAQWNFFKEFPAQLAKVSAQEWETLLEHLLQCHSNSLAPGLFEELIHRAADAGGKPSLVLAIQARKKELVQTLLSSQADMEQRSPLNMTPLSMAIRVRDFPLARQIMERGADLNAQIGHDDHRSALGEACRQEDWDSQERIEGMRIMGDMIGKGAILGIEHLPTTIRPWFRFPLYICAVHGALETATLLLQQHADPNLVTVHSFEYEEEGSIYWKHWPCTVLDAAVAFCRLDMSLLLLKAGGLSSRPGENGYEGLLRMAMEDGNHAAVDMIREHIRSLESEREINPERHRQHLHRIEEVREQARDMLHRAKAGEERLREERALHPARHLAWW